METPVAAPKPQSNRYPDLANERDHPVTPLAEVRLLRDAAKRLDARRLVSALHTHDISRDDLRGYLTTVQVDFIRLHCTRSPQSPALTEAKSREYLARMKKLGRTVPLHCQEPFRRGFRPPIPS